MTQSLCKTPSIRLHDCREVDYNYILTQGLPGIVELAGSTLLPTASEEEIANISSLPHTAGDDAQDVMLGAYNIAANIELLTKNDPYTITSVPAIIVGSGPSLNDHFKELRETYGKYLIVASASAVKPLVEHGIIPHVVAPKERTKYPNWCFDICPDTVLYAGLIVVPDLPKKFNNALCVGDSGDISRWAGCYMPIAPGPSSGTHAMSMALRLTSGNIFLIGMDNCGGHFNGYLGVEQKVDDSCLCYDGQHRESKWIYRVARANMSNKHESRTYQCSQQAAVIEGIPFSHLYGGYPFSISSMPISKNNRIERLRRILRSLPADWDTLLDLTQNVSSIYDTKLEDMDTQNKRLFHALLTPTVMQLSMERRLGMSDKDVLQWYKEATFNMIKTLQDTVQEMAKIGGYNG